MSRALLGAAVALVIAMPVTAQAHSTSIVGFRSYWPRQARVAHGAPALARDRD